MLFQEAPEYEQNFSMVIKVLEYAEVKEEDEEHVSPLDMLFARPWKRKSQTAWLSGSTRYSSWRRAKLPRVFW